MILKIRDLTVADVERCLELNNAATPAVPHMERSALATLIHSSDHPYGVFDASDERQSDERQSDERQSDEVQGGREIVGSSDAPLLGFVLAMLPLRDYASENYRYFVNRGDSFLYVDRIVVDAEIRGVGLGRLLYGHAFGLARAAGLSEVTCEVNTMPPNPESMAFHARLGFAEVGRQATKNGTVEVALLAASVA